MATVGGFSRNYHLAELEEALTRDGLTYSPGERKAEAQGHLEVQGYGRTVLFDDFHGPFVDATTGLWNSVAGSDDLAVAAAFDAAEVGGAIDLNCGDGNGTPAADLSAVHGLSIGWTISKAPLVFQIGVKLSAITNVEVFVGFTDAIATEIAYTMSGTTLTAVADDGAGFLFDTSATTDNWKGVGSLGTSGQAVDLGTAPTAATYQELRLEVDGSGNATFLIDGTQVGALSTLVDTTSLVPVMSINGDGSNTATRVLTVDYIHVSQAR